MACDDAANAALDAAILAALTGPRSVTTDGMTVEQHPIPDLIEARQYLAGRCAVAGRRLGLRHTRIIPPGTVG